MFIIQRWYYKPCIMGSVFQDYLGCVLRPTQAKIIVCNNIEATNTGNTLVTPFPTLLFLLHVIATNGFKH